MRIEQIKTLGTLKEKGKTYKSIKDELTDN